MAHATHTHHFEQKDRGFLHDVMTELLQGIAGEMIVESKSESEAAMTHQPCPSQAVTPKSNRESYLL